MLIHWLICRSLTELGTANAAMRLMVQGEDEEQPIDTFAILINLIHIII